MAGMLTSERRKACKDWTTFAWVSAALAVWSALAVVAKLEAIRAKTGNDIAIVVVLAVVAIGLSIFSLISTRNAVRLGIENDQAEKR